MCLSWTEGEVGKGEEWWDLGICFCGEGEVTHVAEKKAQHLKFQNYIVI